MPAKHHACRAMSPARVGGILKHSPGASSAQPWARGTPGRWSPLQCLVGNACPATDAGEATFYNLVKLVAPNTDTNLLLNQTTTGNSVFHQVASRGHRLLVDLLVERFAPRAAEAININNYVVGGRTDSHCLIQ